jgi:hypothetical protein
VASGGSPSTYREEVESEGKLGKMVGNAYGDIFQPWRVKDDSHNWDKKERIVVVEEEEYDFVGTEKPNQA